MPLTFPNKKSENGLIPINQLTGISKFLHELWNCLSSRVEVGDDLKYLTYSHLVQGQARFECRIWAHLSSQVKMTVDLC